MIIFERYANLDSAQSTADPDAPIRLDIPSARKPGMIASLRYRLDERSGFVRANGWWLYVSTPVGLECYPEVRALLASAQEACLHKVLDQLEHLRLLAFVAYCETTEQVFFGRGLDGFCSLFFGGQGASLIVADDRLEVARLQGPVVLSKADELEWCEYTRVTPEGSFFEGVRRCFAGVRYGSQVDEKETPRRALMAPDIGQAKLPDTVQLLNEGLLQNFTCYGDRRIALRLSGGIDSRALLVGLLEAVKLGILRKDQILCVSVLYPGLDCDESAEILEITRIAGIEWAGIVATRENVEAAYNECRNLPGPQYPTNFMGVLCLQEARRRGCQIVISGHGGDELLDYGLPDLLSLPAFERFWRIRQIRMFLDKGAFLDLFKVLAMAAMGVPALRSINQNLQGYSFTSRFTGSHRWGSRFQLAKGCGYELYSCSAREANLLIDIPFLRAPFWSQVAPWQWVDWGFKAAAVDYMEQYSPEIAHVPLQKRLFSDAVRRLLPSCHPNCDEVDDRSMMRHASNASFRRWKEVSARYKKGRNPR